MLEGKWNKIVGTARIMMVFRWLYEAFGSLAITSHEPGEFEVQHYFCTSTSTSLRYYVVYHPALLISPLHNRKRRNGSA